MSGGPIILVVDDELAIRRLLRAALERGGYRVREAANGREALSIAATEQPALVLLDLGLPDRDGLELIALLNHQSRASVLVISARDATEEKVSALDLGAVDYVTKPFDTEELLARVRAALRHRLLSDGGQSTFSAGPLTIDLLAHRVVSGGAEVHLTPKEFIALAELGRFPGRVITHQRLLRAIWSNVHDGQIEYLRVLIRGLRQKLEPDPSRPSLIINEPGIGYRLIGQSG